MMLKTFRRWLRNCILRRKRSYGMNESDKQLLMEEPFHYSSRECIMLPLEYAPQKDGKRFEVIPVPGDELLQAVSKCLCLMSMSQTVSVSHLRQTLGWPAKSAHYSLALTDMFRRVRRFLRRLWPWKRTLRIQSVFLQEEFEWDDDVVLNMFYPLSREIPSKRVVIDGPFVYLFPH
uniref:Uncharacterized protein n=1 Tax=Steinernema glaseri TaxID=37863 RepID=A0A1I7YDL6_9BILA